MSDQLTAKMTEPTATSSLRALARQSIFLPVSERKKWIAAQGLDFPVSELLLPPLAIRQGTEAGRKEVFFFEKKKQKTFVRWWWHRRATTNR